VDKDTPAERSAYLDSVCGQDYQLRARVEGLLRSHQQAGSFLEQPLFVDAAIVQPSPPGEQPGAVIGPYQLLEPLGEGGMGTVFLAAQSRPVQRRVALKVIKPGMDSAQVLARFEAERQALALMDHPHIAKVHDAGTTETGRPYFVMELVGGVPITRYCDEHRLTIRKRLELFVPVCQAVQHAHQKGIIHRDLKPSNVLVVEYDGKPVVKVIDFGVAKAIGPRLSEEPSLTEVGQVVGTLEYMSPEQAELNPLDIDTRSDIYSLGVLVYELLTGSTPLERQRLGQVPLLEVLRIIREEEPPTPSTRLSTTEGLPSVAANRSLEPRKLSGQVRGELDWIVMKCLEKDRSRRYETANALALDLQRYLADQPVQAGPPSAWYRFCKFTRRHKTGLVVAGLILLLLLLLGGGSGWVVLDRVARQAKLAGELELTLQRAELLQEQGRRAEALAAFEHVQRLANETNPDPELQLRLEALQGRLEADGQDLGFIAGFENLRLREQSRVNESENLFASMVAYPRIKKLLHQYGLDAGRTPISEAVTRIQGRPPVVQQQLQAALHECWRFAPAKDTVTRAWLAAVLNETDRNTWRRQVREALAAGHWSIIKRLACDVDTRRHPANFLLWVAWNLLSQDSRAAVDLFGRIQRDYPGDFWANHDLGIALSDNGQPGRAVRYYTAALALRPKNAGVFLNRANALQRAGESDAAIADYRQAIALAPGYARAHDHLGLLHVARGELVEGIKEHRMAIQSQPEYALTHENLGNALKALGQMDEAIAAYREAVRLKPDHAQGHFNLGLTLATHDRLDEAVTAYREAIRHQPEFVRAHYNLGILLQRKKRWAEAIAAYREVIRLRPDHGDAHYNLGLVLHDNQQMDEAIIEYRAAIRLLPELAEAHNNLGNALKSKSLWDDAIAAYHEAIKLRPELIRAHYNLGNALQARRRWDEAIAAYRAAIRLKPDFISAHYNLGIALQRKQEWDEAIAVYQKLIQIKPDHAQGHNNLGLAYKGKGQWDEAITAYRKALHFKPDLAQAHFNLGVALRQQGDFAGALAALRRSHELGAKDPSWRLPSAQLVRDCERLLALDARLPKVLAHEVQPADAAEYLALAALCRVYKKRYAAAARLYTDAFTASPKLADNPSTGHRYHAACAAALAGCGQGADAGPLDDQERARLRRQALTWLQADLVAWKKQLDREPGKAGPNVQRTMRHWQQDADLAGVRDAAALARLPEAERQPWQQLWNEVETLAHKTAGLKKY
jgi:tetratricopeptide (TPR) repeat protein